jgi:hypothetical protein
MHAIILLCALLAAPFWETKGPRDWTDAELTQMLNSSPWAQAATAEGIVRQAGVQTYLSSSLPMQEAEAELTRRRMIRNRAYERPDTAEYLEFLKQQKDESIVLTISFPDPNQLADAAEAKRMEEECIMKIGRKKYKMTGHFPPAPGDPYLRLVFPRVVEPKDKIIQFDLYLPGAPDPYRTVEYVVKELVYRGKPEI